MPAKKAKIAVIQFPGTNCELETARALERNGLSAELFRWNEKKSLAKFNGAILAGGFSYEDRGRSGLIASKDPLLKEIYKLAKSGGVVLGICNGAQVLVETGLVPNFEFGKSTLALTRNRRVKDGEIQGENFYNDWIYLQANSEKPNAFNQFDTEKILHIPLAHAEGRFFSPDAKLLEQIVTNGQNAFIYCDKNGEINPEFPTNPNGSVLNLAGVTNSAGNVMALMPHPERTSNGDVIFKSIKKWITGKVKKPKAKKIVSKSSAEKILPKPKFNVELFVNLKITDNEALSVGSAAGMDLQKFRWFGMNFSGSKKDLEKIIRSGDLLNTEKENVFIKSGKTTLHFNKEKGLVTAKFSLPKNKILACEREASLDESHAKNVNKTLGKKLVKSLKSGTVWATEDSDTKFKQALKNNFFHHPAAMDLLKI